MTDRVILAVKFTPAGAGAQVRRSVGGFLRYVQHRDFHPVQSAVKPRHEVSALLKYVAYRDRASNRAELFGPSGTLSTGDRKAFANFVANALDGSAPQLFRGRDGRPRDRRRAVYRMVISPERAAGLDLRRLTTAAVGRLERESGMTGLRWLAAIHRNTAHYHVHLVVAGMHLDSGGGYRRLDLTKPRLAAMKDALSLEIEHQRTPRLPTPNRVLPAVAASQIPPACATPQLAARVATRRLASRTQWNSFRAQTSVISLRAVARRYQHRMERELEEAHSRREWEHAA
jgi:hypothetical protein